MFIEENEKKISLNITPERSKMYNRVAEKLGLDEDYGKTEIFDKVFEVVEKKLTPKDSLPSDIEKISQLELKLKAMTDEKNEALQLLHAEIEKTAKLIDENSKLTEKIRETLTENQTLIAQIEATEEQVTDIINESNRKIHLKENQYLLNLSNVQELYLKETISNKKIKEFFADIDKTGKLQKIIPQLNQTDKENLPNIILAWFFYSVKLGKYPFIDFNTWLQKNKNKFQ